MANFPGGRSVHLNFQPGVGGQGSLKGQMALINNHTHKLDAWAQHDRFLNKNFKLVGPATNSAGLNYNHVGGGAAFVSGSKTAGVPVVATVGGSVPIFKSDSGLSGNLNYQPGVGGQGSVKGQMALINNDTHKLDAWAQHDRFLNKHFKPVGPATNSAGLNYNHVGGSATFLSGSKTAGVPVVGTVGGSVPVFKSASGNTSLNVGGSTTFAKGSQPNHSVSLSFMHKF